MQLTGLIIVILILLIIMGVVIFNRLVRGRNLVKEGWSGIDVQLKRRHDLIPNIVETVKGYAGHEKQLFEEVSRIRSNAENSKSVKESGLSEIAVTKSLRNLFALAEAYPELKANQNFMELQKTLAEIEEQISLARRYYNGTARDMNILVESFPSSIVAGLSGFKKADFFEIEYAAHREAPEVKLA
jgi:LemA protein